MAVDKKPNEAWDAYMQKYDYVPPPSLTDWPVFLRDWVASHPIVNNTQTYAVPVEYRSRPFRGLYKAAIHTMNVEATNTLQAGLLARDEAAKKLGHRFFGAGRGDFIVASVTVLQIGGLVYGIL